MISGVIYGIWYTRYMIYVHDIYMISGTPDTWYLPWCRYSFNFPDTVICCTKVSNFDQVQFIYSCEATMGPKEPKQSWERTKFKASYLQISKWVASPGSMHDTGCLGLVHLGLVVTQRDGRGREAGGGFRMGNTCIPVADSFWYLAKLIQFVKFKNKKNLKKKMQ